MMTQNRQVFDNPSRLGCRSHLCAEGTTSTWRGVIDGRDQERFHHLGSDSPAASVITSVLLKAP